MKTKQNLRWTLAAVLALGAVTVHAQQIFKANNNTDPSTAGSWVGGVAPGSSQVAVWDATVATPSSCTNSMANSASWGGILVSNPAAPISITSSSTSKTLTVGASGINLSNATQDMVLTCPVTASTAQTWAIANGHILTVGMPGTSGASVGINADLTVYGYLRANSKDVRIPGTAGGLVTLTIPPGTTIEVVSNSDSSFSLGYTSSAVINQNGGVLKLGKVSTSKASLSICGAAIANSTYNLNGGLIVDTNSPASDFIMVGDGGTGTLNVSGGSILVQAIQAGNTGLGTINVTNGSITTIGGDFVLAKGTSSPGAALNVYGGTISIANGALVVGKGSSAVNPAAVYLANGGISMSGSLQIPGGSAKPATVTIDSGTMTVSNTVSLAGSGSGSGTLNLNGGVLTANGVNAGTGTGGGTFNFNGGTLKARQGNGSFIAATNPLTVNVLAGGAVIDTAAFNVTLPAALLNGTGGAADGGLTKLGSGTLTLAGANTYNGPTTVTAGVLGLTTPYSIISPIQVNDGAGFDAQLTTNGPTLFCSSLAFGTSPAGNVTSQFDLGSIPNPSLPLVYATNLMATGTVTVNVYGDSLSIGTIHLIQYAGSDIVGGGSFQLGLVQGFIGYVTNNTTTHSVDLVITGVSVLGWRALVNNNWDAATANWWDLSNSVAAKFANGSSVIFDDTTSNSFVNVGGQMLPGSITVNNTLSNYTFSGTGAIGGTADFLKTGAGTVTMALSNFYAGDTVINNGTFRLGTTNAIPGGVGFGDVYVDGSLDLAGYNNTFNALNGTNGFIDNTASTPAVLTISRHTGIFAGQITNSGAGPLALNVASGGLALLSRNNYRGGTTNSGNLQLAFEQSIGSGPLALNGGSLYWTDASAHVLTNLVTIGGNVTFGQPTNGPLTVTRQVDFKSSRATLTCNTDVQLSNGMTNGSLGGKAGPGTLILNNSVADWSGGSFSLNNGVLILNSCVVTQDNNNFRIQCSTNSTARLVINNGSVLTMVNSATANFRFGDSATAGTDATNVLDLAGTLYLTPYVGSNNKFQMGSSTDPSGQNIVNLLPGGLLRVRQVLDAGPSSTSIFNFNGGTLSPSTNDTATAFMQGLDACYVLDGGAVIDTAGFDIAIGQSIQSGGSGGLTKQGLGKLDLNAANSYTGPTVVQAGTLGGTGSLSSPVTVQSGATLAPGASIGTMYIFNTLTLSSGSTTAMEISMDGDSPSSDNILGITTLNYGGTLVVTNIGATTLAAGNTFSLFSAGVYNGSFALYNLPVLPAGLAWDTTQLAVNGSLQVISRPTPPSFGSIVSQNGNGMVISGSGGTAGGDYYVLSSTNLALPLTGWDRIATYQFDGSGNFSFTNEVSSSEAQRFFRIQLP